MKTKKILATLLSLAFAVCSIPAFALADEVENGDDIQVTQEDQIAVSPDETGEPGGDEEDEPDPNRLLKGYSASIQDDGIIGVNFFLDLSEVEISGNPYMEFTVTDQEGNITTQTADYSFSTVTSPGGETQTYKFTVGIAAKDMTSDITAKLYDGSGFLESFDYSLAEYLNSLIDDPRGSYNDYADLARALLDYGTYAQIYFGHNTDELANGGTFTTDVSRVTSAKIETASKPDIFDYDPDDNISFYGASLSLKSKTSLTLYIANQSGSDVNYDVALPSEDITWEHTTKNGYDVFVFTGFTADLLNEKVMVTAKVGSDEVLTVCYRPLGYVYTVLNKETDSRYTEDLKNLVRSLYIFYDEVAQEFGGPGYISPFN
ncbi:MAG: hypothetical protein II718_05575 [Clostridiales bacterium]|nr:hypothetical protein [Clostridiales bacterium]